MILVDEGQCPLILCLPHSGTEMPNVLANRLNATGRLQADISWHLERVFDFCKELDVTIVRSSISRFVIDVDQDPSQQKDETADPSRVLCPTMTMDGKRIYRQDEEPGPTEIEQRSLLFYMPFHKALGQQVDRLARKHKDVIVLDCQSMRSNLRRVTDTEVPLINIGTGEGQTCASELKNLFVGSFNAQQEYAASVDKHTTGGFITRTFGRPEKNLHAMSLLIAQRAYVRHESPPFEPDKLKFARLKAALADNLSRIIDWASVREVPSTPNKAPGRTAPVAVTKNETRTPVQAETRAPSGKAVEASTQTLLIAE